MKTILYHNELTTESATADWIAEGHIDKMVDPVMGTLLGHRDPESMGDHAHWTYWLPQVFPANIQIDWDFRPLSEPGLCMVFFAAAGRNGEALFDEHLHLRDGYYPQYHHGDINAYHISYFRHKQLSERGFRTCNLRKSFGFNLAAQGADPLPPAEDALGFYHLRVIKDHDQISFAINDLVSFSWQDDGKQFGPLLGAGAIGFRQMAPMRAAYRNLTVTQL